MPCICCSASNVDNLYQASYAPEQKVHRLQWARLMSVTKMANKMMFVMLMEHKQFKAYLSQFFLSILTDRLCLRVAQMSRCRDLAILVVTTDERQKMITLPLTHTHGITICR